MIVVPLLADDLQLCERHKKLISKHMDWLARMTIKARRAHGISRKET